jgi:hypothetical protein
MNSFRDYIDLKSLAILIVEDLRVDGGRHSQWIVQRWTFGNGKHLSVCASKEGHYLRE